MTDNSLSRRTPLLNSLLVETKKGSTLAFSVQKIFPASLFGSLHFFWLACNQEAVSIESPPACVADMVFATSTIQTILEFFAAYFCCLNHHKHIQASTCSLFMKGEEKNMGRTGKFYKGWVFLFSGYTFFRLLLGFGPKDVLLCSDGALLLFCHLSALFMYSFMFWLLSGGPLEF